METQSAPPQAARTENDLIGLRWSIASLALAVTASLALAFIPLVTPSVDVPQKPGPTTPTLAPTRETVIDSAGVGGALVLLWPIAVGAAVFRLRRRAEIRGFRAIATILLLPLLPIGSFAVGGFYVPSAFSMALSSVRRRPAGTS